MTHNVPAPGLSLAGLSFAGQMAVITGAGSPTGIGFATARLLGAAGAAVAITSTTDRIHMRAQELRDQGIHALSFVADLTDPRQVADFAAYVLARRGHPEVLVNNAGMVSIGTERDPAKPLEDLSLEEWITATTRNLHTSFLVTRAFLPHMKEVSYGRVIFVSSTTGPVNALPFRTAYAAPKAALLGLTKALALEVARNNVTVNLVAPGWVDTGALDERRLEAGAASPVGRPGTSDELAWTILFLSSPAASYVTGQMLVVDGGNSIVEDLAHRD